MNVFVSRATGWAYRRAVKPILFRMKPDDVHDRMVSTAYWTARHPYLLWPVRKMLKYDSPRLMQTLGGITFSNVIGLTAGIDKNAQMPAVCEAVGFGMIEVGTMTIEPCPGNPRPWFYRLKQTKSLVVHAGLANQGIDANMRRLREYPAAFWGRMVLNVSVGKTNSRENVDDTKGIADNVRGIKRVLDEGIAHMITINISCPNTYGGEPFTDTVRLGMLMDEVARLHPEIPFSVKLPIDKPWEEFKPLLDVLARYEFVKFVTIGNLAKDRSAIDFKDSLPPDVRGNFSGRPTWERSNALISRTYQEFRHRFVIIGVGGVFTPEDAYTKITLGASLVELATGMIFEGPQLIGQINKYIDDKLQKEGRTIRELVGSAAGRPQ